MVWVLPTSGSWARPVSRPITQLCKGQVTLLPETMPSDSGPFLCGHSSTRAKNLSSPVRNTAMGLPPMPKHSRRAPRTGILASGPIFFQIKSPSVRTSGIGQLRQLGEFMRVHTGGAFRPGIVLDEFLGIKEAGIEAAAVLRILHHMLLHIVDADTGYPGRGALQIVCLFAIDLHK